MSFWSVEVKRGIPEYYRCVPGDGKTGLRLTQATLGKGSSKDNSYVECYVDGSKIPICICSLIPNKTETQILDLIFSNKQDVKFSVVGPRCVFLLGHYLYDRSSSRQTDSEPLGFNIEYSDESWEDSTRKKREKDENKYDVNDSFIDDKSITDDTLFGRLRPLSGKKEKVLKKKTKKKKKKGFVVSESEDDGEGIQLYI
ncbi:hypothetical protein ACP275_01G119900 [Erythranthe tilingii]